MPTNLPPLTIGRRRFFVVQAGLGVRHVIESEQLEDRRMLTSRWIVGPWRLLVTGTRDMYADRRARYLNRISGGAYPRRAVR